MRLALSLLFLSALSLGEGLQVDGFEEWVVHFKTEAKRYASFRMSQPVIDSLVIELGDVSKENELGICIGGNTTTPKIVLNRKEWDHFSNPRKEQVLLHEFGHCILKRDHKETYVQAGERIFPSSIMASRAFDEEIYVANRDYYLSELFMRAEVLWK